MANYDISIMKNNIKSLMEKRNIKQTQLADAVGISQPQISSVLNSQNSNSFTVAQLVDISHFLECSVDEILGLNKSEKKKEIKSLADILNVLFELDSAPGIGLEIGTCKTGSVEHIYDDFYSDIETTGFYFNIPEMKVILDEWNNLKNTNIEKKLKERILDLWKDESIKKYSSNKKEWGFRNELSWGRCLAKLCLQDAGYECTIDDDLIGEDYQCDENFPILEKYVKKYMQNDDFFSIKERNAIYDFIYNNSKCENEPPFD